MKVVVQRVSEAEVRVDGEITRQDWEGFFGFAWS